MKYYELTYLISPDLSEGELKILQEKINSIIQIEGGKMERFKFPIKRKLAYPIKKRAEAFLVTLEFYFPSEKLENLEKKLKEESKILRHLILTKKVEIPEIVPEIKVPKMKKERKVEIEKIEEKLKEILGEI